jgi:hypothetical protein
MHDVVDYYLSPFAPLIEAMVRAEGGETAFLKAVRCSMPNTRTYDEALARCAKTLRNRAVAWEEFDQGALFQVVRYPGTDPWTGEDRPARLIVTDEFIKFLGARWAPLGAENDPHHLNENWVKNVVAIYHKLVMEVPHDAPETEDANRPVTA